MRLSYNGQYTSLPSWGRGFDTPQPLQRNESYQQRTAAPQDSLHFLVSITVQRLPWPRLSSGFGHYFDRVIEKLMGQLLPDKEFPSPSATLRSYPSVQICHPDHAPHPLHYTYQSRAVWSRFIPHHCPGSIAGRSPAESRNQGKTESSCFG